MTAKHLSTREFIQELLTQLDREVEIVNEGAQYTAKIDYSKDKTVLTLSISLKEADEPFAVTTFDLEVTSEKDELNLAQQLESAYVLLSEISQKGGI